MQKKYNRFKEIKNYNYKKEKRKKKEKERKKKKGKLYRTSKAQCRG